MSARTPIWDGGGRNVDDVDACHVCIDVYDIKPLIFSFNESFSFVLLLLLLLSMSFIQHVCGHLSLP